MDVITSTRQGGTTYHPDAVLVSNDGTRSIAWALAGWGEDMVANKPKGTRATVEFRVTKGKWRIVMERQLYAVTESTWNAISH